MLAVTCIYTLLKARSHNFVKYYFGLRIRTHVQIHVKVHVLIYIEFWISKGEGDHNFFCVACLFF